MSDYQAALAHTASAPAAAAARPRISADAFRNLTARLKKGNVQIPTLTPLAEPAVAAAVEAPGEATLHVEPDASLRMEAVAPVVLHEVPEQSAAVVEALLPEHPVAEPLLESHGDLESENEAVMAVLSHAADPVEIAPVKPLEVAEVPAIEPLQIPVVGTGLDELPEAEFQQVSSPQQAEVAIDLDILPSVADLPNAPLSTSASSPAQTASNVEPEIGLESLPQSSEVHIVSAAPEVLDIDVAALPAEPAKRFPDLPEYVPPTTAVEQPVATEPVLQGSFADNFTYVPEKGKEESAPHADLSNVDAAIKQEVAQRATELALENNWRLLLAKPTAEDRAVYLREAAEYHAADDEWNKPAPEHDLSQITPADEVVPEPVLVPQPTGNVERSLVDNMSATAGQDLSEVARSLLDMMAAGNSSGLPQERALAADTLLRLVPRLELKPVVLLAQRLSIMDNPPHLLVARLIRDPRVEVAGPLLEDCAHISDQDLESVVQEGEPDKLRMIARRRKLSRAISDALIKSGEASVVLTLVRNAEAEISHDGFASLLVLCQNNPELLAPLATRRDLSAPYAFEMFWLAPAQLRRFILSRFLTDSETLTKILKITLATNTSDEADVEPLSQHAMLEALERAARGHMEVASEELANLMQLGPATVQRILNDLEGDPLVVMLKAAGYPRSAVPGLLKRMQDADLPVISRERDISELQNMFETLSFNKARILLTYWDWAQKKLGPYAPVQ